MVVIQEEWMRLLDQQKGRRLLRGCSVLTPLKKKLEKQLGVRWVD
jgi:hypothetical protein